MDCIAYRGGYKYQTEENYSFDSGIQPQKEFSNDYLAITADGRLSINKGYAWDGPSGPTADTPNFMRGSLIHDALYQLMREHALNNIEDRHAFGVRSCEITFPASNMSLRANPPIHTAQGQV